jgi:hypothetical protein
VFILLFLFSKGSIKHFSSLSRNICPLESSSNKKAKTIMIYFDGKITPFPHMPYVHWLKTQGKDSFLVLHDFCQNSWHEIAEMLPPKKYFVLNSKLLNPSINFF